MHTEHDHTHAHDHDHTSEHAHMHTHEHGHMQDDHHGRSHDHIHEASSDGASPKDLALLRYMLEHNRQHARELADVGARLATAGIEGAAALVSDAVHYFDHANEKLERAVGMIGGGD